MKDIRIELSAGSVFKIKNGPTLEVMESDGGCTDCYFNNGSDGCSCLEVLACSYGEDRNVIFFERKEE